MESCLSEVVQKMRIYTIYKLVKILTYLSQVNDFVSIRELASSVGLTYSQTYHLVKKLIKCNVLAVTKVGRVMHVKLLDKSVIDILQKMIREREKKAKL